LVSFFEFKNLKEREVFRPLNHIYLPVPQAQFSPHKQGLQVQFGLSLFTSIVVVMIFCFYVID